MGKEPERVCWVTWIYDDVVISRLQFSLNVTCASLWSICSNLVPELFPTASHNVFSKLIDLNDMTSNYSELYCTNLTVPILAIINLADRELERCTGVMWFYNDEIICSLQVIMNVIVVSYQSYCLSLVTANFAERELILCFNKATWSSHGDVIISLQAILNWFSLWSFFRILLIIALAENKLKGSS